MASSQPVIGEKLKFAYNPKVVGDYLVTSIQQYHWIVDKCNHTVMHSEPIKVNYTYEFLIKHSLLDRNDEEITKFIKLIDGFFANLHQAMYYSDDIPLRILYDEIKYNEQLLKYATPTIIKL